MRKVWKPEKIVKLCLHSNYAVVNLAIFYHENNGVRGFLLIH